MLKNRTNSRTTGFTLIEVTVALAIAALGLGVLVSAAGTGLGNTTLAHRYIDATRRAQSHLSAVGTLTPLRPGVQSGNDGDGYSWQVRISEPVLHAPGPGPQNMLGLYTIEVTLSWRTGVSTRSFSLRSQRLAYLADGNG